MNTLEEKIMARGTEIRAILVEMEYKAAENDLPEFIDNIYHSPKSLGPPFKDSFNNSFNKGWGNYGKS